MQQCREPNLSVLLLCFFAHTVQPVWPAFPARCPALVRLSRVLLGQRPSLHNLRRRSPVLVRLLRWYYAAVRLPRAEAKSCRACGSYSSSLSPTGPPPCEFGRQRGLSVLARGASPLFAHRILSFRLAGHRRHPG